MKQDVGMRTSGWSL